MNKHKAMIIPDHNCQTIKNLFVTINPGNACKMKFADNLWIPFLDQPQ